MRITFFGHAAFLIEAAALRIILDPYRYPDAGGYAPINEPADLVVISHINDRYHSHTGQIRPPFQLLNALEFPPDGRECLGLRFHAVPVYESPEKQPGDEVTIVHFEAEGKKIVFLGDLGHPLSDLEIRPLQGADIVLAPAGGPPTIPLTELRDLLEAIDPRVVIPMHYKTPRINLPILSVEEFLATMSAWPVTHDGSSTFVPTEINTSSRRQIVHLEPSR